MTKLSDFRKSYELGELDEVQAENGPLALFHQWMDQAIAHDVSEPTAMTLATVGANGRPSTRVVLLKGCDERGMVWFTNYDSRKGEELAGNPFAALQFHWVEMERVVRIEGRVEDVGTGVRRLLQEPSPRLAPGRLGFAAEPGDFVTRGAGGQCRQGRRAARVESGPAAALGRVSPRAGPL